jgi:4-aminobutyrate aminotransferase / (S)-3-amino-2-methylpropionate transaminase / 5-aminovalerate transaminase
MAKYSLVPIEVPKVHTKYRRIRTALPVPASLPILKTLAECEPVSMAGQPPVIWDRAEGSSVWDRWGNRWIDWSSGVLIANAGHGRREIVRALRRRLSKPLLATYCFPHESRARLVKELKSLSPDPARYRVFLLSTGSEATENCIKLARTYALRKYGPKRRFLISFENAFHGRTLGAQLAGGAKRQKEWIVGEGQTFAQVPFPDGYKNEDTCFDLFLRTLKERGISPEEIAGVMTESFQGVGPDFFPQEYVRKLEEFCRENDIVMIFDEIQAGFGRSGKMFTYQHYGVVPDLIACGKGITSSLPLAAVIGRDDIMDLYPPGSMTSTHSASPLAVEAALENLKLIIREKLPERAAELGERFLPLLARIQERHPDTLGCLHGRGLVAGIQVVKKGTREPDPETALRINEACFRKGLLMFAPVGVAGECVKIGPPLTIAEGALLESVDVLQEACAEVLGR